MRLAGRLPQISRRLGVFDTIVMYGNNFGLMESFRRARWLLRRFHAVTSQRGRMGGQARIRIRYKLHATPWFDYLFVSKPELAVILDGTGWRVAKTFDADWPRYIVVLEKESRP